MKFFSLLIISIFLASCIKQIKPNLRVTDPILVVDGLLQTDSTPCKVVLSYSGIFNENGAQLPNYIDDAIVFLKDDDTKDSIQLINQQNGTYVSEYDFFAKVGESYSLSILLSNGERYASNSEKIVPVPKNFELDTIAISVPPGFPDLYGANVQIKLQDPSEETNYYRWTTTDYLPRKATGIPCGFSMCNQYCYQQYFDNTMRILSDAAINGNEIRKQSVLISPYYYYGTHFIEIKQLSLTRQAYEFWKLYSEQVSRTGTIFDPLPAPLQGNIYNVYNPNKLTLGYFEASDVYSKKFILAPLFMYSYYTLAYVTRYIYPDIGSCWDVYPNAYENAPAGWENVPETIYKVFY